MTEKPARKRRWFRFSLKTMLVVVVVLCVGLGWFAFKWREAERQRKAVMAIEKEGGEVAYDWEVDESGMPMTIQVWSASAWLRERLGPDFFADVVSVDLSDYSNNGVKGLVVFSDPFWADEAKTTSPNDAELQNIEKLTELRALWLTGCPVTDVGLERLKGLKNLKSLDLGTTQVTDGGLEHIKELKRLERLDLPGTHVTDAGLEHLKTLTELDYLDLSDTHVTEKGIEELQKALPNCQIRWDEGDTF